MEIEAHITERFEVQKLLGKGAYGYVWQVAEKQSNRVLALKKIFDAFMNEIDAQRTYREVKYLFKLKGHENIIRLEEVIRSINKADIYLVFEIMDADLHFAIKDNCLGEIHKKFIIYQLLKSLKYIHSAGLIHRDLKPSNILINKDCVIKLGDFGLARSVHSDPGTDPIVSDYVATRWYRAPEILLGSQSYGYSIDTWSAGCILAELFLNRTLFTGKSTLNQMELIIQLLGRPTTEDVHSFASETAEGVVSMLMVRKTKSFRQVFACMGDAGIDLLKRMLVYNPQKRITIDEALNHPYLRDFTEREDPIESCPTIRLPIDDNQRLTADQYRKALYNEYCSDASLDSTNRSDSKVVDIKVPGEILTQNSNPNDSWHDHSQSLNHGEGTNKPRLPKTDCNIPSGSGITAAGTVIGSASTGQPTNKQSGHSATPSNILSQPSSFPRHQLHQESNSSAGNQHNSSQLTLSPVHKSILQNTHLKPQNTGSKQAVLVSQLPVSPNSPTSPQFQAKIQSILQSTILGKSAIGQTATEAYDSYQGLGSPAHQTHSPPLSPSHAHCHVDLGKQFLNQGLRFLQKQPLHSPGAAYATAPRTHHIGNSISAFDDASINMHCQSQLTAVSHKKQILSKKKSSDMLQLPKSKSKERPLKKKKSIDFAHFGPLAATPQQEGILDFAKKRLTATLIQVPSYKSPLPNKKVVQNAGTTSASRLRPSKNRTMLIQANTSLNRRGSNQMIADERQVSFTKQLKKKVSARSISPGSPQPEAGTKHLIHSRSAKGLEAALSIHQSVQSTLKQSGSSSQLLNSSNSAHRRHYSPTAQELLQNMIALERTESFFKQFEPLKRKAKPLEKSLIQPGSLKSGGHVHSTSTVQTAAQPGAPRSKVAQTHTESVRSGLKRSGSPGFTTGPSSQQPLGLQALSNLSQMKSSTRNLLNNQHLLGIFKNLG